MENRIKALLIALEEEVNTENMEAVEHNYGDCFTYDGTDYNVLTDEEATEEVTDYIKESVCYFNPNFLASQTGLDEVIFEALCSLDEKANEAILALIENTCGLEEFVSEAVFADGRGHFLNHYNGDELEAEVDGEYYYIYIV